MSNKGKEKGPRMDKPRTNKGTCEQNTEQRGRWDELIEIMDELSTYRAHFVVLLAKLYRDMERNGK